MLLQFIPLLKINLEAEGTKIYFVVEIIQKPCYIQNDYFAVSLIFNKQLFYI